MPLTLRKTCNFKGLTEFQDEIEKKDTHQVTSCKIPQFPGLREFV